MKTRNAFMNLYNHQITFLSKKHRKCLLAWEMGTGKTRVAIEWVKQNKFKQVVIICPKALRENWKREAERWGLDPLHYFIFSKEEFRKLWAKIAWTEAIIVDEAHYFAGIKSAMTKSLMHFLKKNKVSNILLLTGTPYLSTPFNVYV